MSARRYPPEVQMLIATGLIARDPDSWDDDFIHSKGHYENLFERLGVVIGLTETPEGFKTDYTTPAAEAHRIMLEAQTSGKDRSGNLLYASDFPILGQFTGWTI